MRGLQFVPFVVGPELGVERLRIAQSDCVADSDRATDDHSCIESRAVDQGAEDRPIEESLEVRAGHIQTAAVQHARTDREVLPDEM